MLSHSNSEVNEYDEEASSTDDGKRKREEGTEESPFVKSRKTHRSPPKKTVLGEQVTKKDLNELKTMFLSMMNEIKEMKQDQRSLIEETKGLREEVESLKGENELMKRRIQEMELRMEREDKEKRRNNVIVKGIDLKHNTAEAEKFFKDKLGSQVKVNTIIEPQKGKDKLISVVKLNSRQDKELIMENKNKLRGTGVYIDNDLTKTESSVQKQLRDIAKEERQKGKTVKVAFQKIYIEGRCWEWNAENNSIQPKN